MVRVQWIGLLAAGCVILALGAAEVRAQKPPTRFKAEGKVVSVADGTIQMRDAKHGMLTIKIPKDRKVVAVTGKMQPSQLANGMIVRVIGKLQGAALADPVSQITLYRPLEGYVHGVLADDPNAVMVTGTVAGYKEGKLIIAAGNRKITAPLTDDAVVTVETGDYSIVQPGDAIVANVSRSKPTNINVNARDVQITLTIPEPQEQKPEKKGK